MKEFFKYENYFLLRFLVNGEYRSSHNSNLAHILDEIAEKSPTIHQKLWTIITATPFILAYVTILWVVAIVALFCFGTDILIRASR